MAKVIPKKNNDDTTRGYTREKLFDSVEPTDYAPSSRVHRHL